jgi:iron-sulfur cluster assembly protein
MNLSPRSPALRFVKTWDLNKPMITITETAAKRIVSNIARRGSGVGIKVGVKTTGCSGMAYVLEYLDQVPVTRDWFSYEQHGATVWVSGRDSVFLDGVEIDYVRKGLNEGFEFNNPKEKARCGCGESFTV